MPPPGTETIDDADRDRAESRSRPGHDAEKPHDVPLRGWKQILVRTKDELKNDSVPLLGAGVAFYALLALVPGLVALVSIYGLVADPADIQTQITDVLAAAPAEVRDLVDEQLTSVATSDDTGLGVGVAIGVILALWSASSGMKHLMTAINAAYDETETRGFVALRGTALLLTVGAVLALTVSIGLIAVLPAALAQTGLGDVGRVVIGVLRWPLLAGLLVIGLAVLYRYAPDRDQPQWIWLAPGTAVAVVGWLLASAAFSFYTANFGSYGETYGSLGAVVVVMLWLMISATVIVIGAELNAEAEHQTRHDTTTGDPEPKGDRDAYVADTEPADPSQDRVGAGNRSST